MAYQWLWNGTVISGANSSFYTTQTAQPADNGSVISVTVTNSQGSVTSQGAVLNVPGAPRAPKVGDLRFKDVDAFPYGLAYADTTALVYSLEKNYQQATGTPLTVGGIGPTPGGAPGSTIWWYAAFKLPANVPARTYCVDGGLLTNLATDLEALDVPGTVITSLDLAFNNSDYAKSWLTTTATGTFTATRQFVDPSTLQTVATQAGTSGQVITALSFDASGKVYVIAYSWDQDPMTEYEANVAFATNDTVEATAQSLAQAGYIITAIGGQTNSNTQLLVGTKVKGDTTPRPVTLYHLGTSVQLNRADAIVGYVYSSLSPRGMTWIGQQ
jgi:hypothetical protein